MVKPIVTFNSSAFNTTDPKDYFINPCCFGDDLAIWFSDQLRRKGHRVVGAPGQEDFGWFFNFVVSGVEHCFVIGHRPGDEQDEPTWIGRLERTGFLTSLLGRRKKNLQAGAALAIHEVLSTSPQIRNVRWHLRSDFDRGQEELGTSVPD
jgi:hypothetical protein